MTWHKYVTLWCDGENCSEHRSADSGSVKLAEKNFCERADWVKADTNEHYCPDCAEENGLKSQTTED